MTSAPANPAPQLTARESFSGPADVLGAAHTAAAEKFGPRTGGWSRWVMEAVTEKLRAERPELLDALEKFASARPAERPGLLSKIEALLHERPGLEPELDRLVRDMARQRRTARRTAA